MRSAVESHRAHRFVSRVFNIKIVIPTKCILAYSRICFCCHVPVQLSVLCSRAIRDNFAEVVVSGHPKISIFEKLSGMPAHNLHGKAPEVRRITMCCYLVHSFTMRRT